MQRHTETSGWRWFVAALVVVAPVVSTSNARAADQTQENQVSGQVAATDVDLAQALRDAVADETVGDEKARIEKLDVLIEALPDSPAPRWQRGLMKTAEGWRDSADCVVDVSETDEKYRELRDRTEDDFAGNKQLARFCQRNKLADSARGHWRRVLDFNPSDSDARKALGHILFEGTWTTKEESKRVAKVRKEYNVAMTEWSKKIPGWITDWRSSDVKRKEKARENLLTIRDAAAIPLLYGTLAYRSTDDSLLLLEILRHIPDMESTRIFAEYGVMNQSPQVLDICSEELKLRDEQSYVPQLLIGLSSPVLSEMRLEVVPQLGQVFYRHAFVREGQYDRQMQVFASDYGQYVQNPHQTMQYKYYSVDDGPGAEAKARKRAAEDDQAIRSKNRAEADRANSLFMEEVAYGMLKMALRERQRVLQNMNIEETNNRISLLLAKIFDENHGRPEDWWKWWNNRHEMQQAAQKPLVAQEQYHVNVDVFQTQSFEQSVNDLGTRPTGGRSYRAFGGMLGGIHSCFVAGTPVVTPHGTRAIESLKTGDLVLSQSIETGEIAWKPVIRPTTRPKTEVLKITIGDESFVCTLKHPFWKAGRGWVWAKDLVVGDLVRSSNGSLPITDIETQPDAPVFNLVVSDFSTYFVGKNRTLTHDITLRMPTLVIAPGVLPAE